MRIHNTYESIYICVYIQHATEVLYAVGALEGGFKLCIYIFVCICASLCIDMYRDTYIFKYIFIYIFLYIYF